MLCVCFDVGSICVYPTKKTHSTWKNYEHTVVDSSEGKDPLSLVFGSGSIIPGLEKQLENKNVGDKVMIIYGIKPLILSLFPLLILKTLPIRLMQ